MKTIMFICLALAAGSAFAQNNSITVVIKNVKDAPGNVAVALFNNEKDFMKNRFDSKIIKAQGGEVQVVFENVPPGSYAISVLHDENGNNEMDSNIIGMPKEGFGFSNNAMGTFGPPSFEKASFKCLVSQALTVNMKYM